MDWLLRFVLLCVIMSYGYALIETTPQPQSSAENNVNRTVKLTNNFVHCTEETKVDPVLVLKLRSGKLKRTKKEPLPFKKWALCVLVKSGMMSRDGVLKQDVVLAPIPEKDKNKVEQVIDECLFQKAHSPVDIAWHYIRCFQYRYPKYSII